MHDKLSHSRTKKLVLTALFAALTAIATTLISIPVGNGYVHLGDGVIFSAAVLLGPWAALAGGIGSAIADIAAGYVIYAPATLVIKAGMGWLAARLLTLPIKRSIPRLLIACAAAEILMIAGYFAYEYLLFGAAAAFTAVAPNLIQALGGIVVGMTLTPLAQGLGKNL